MGNPDGNLDPTTPNAGAHPVTSVGTGIQSVSTAGQWDWQDISNNANGLTVTVSIPNLSAFGLASELRLVGWNGTQWVNLSASIGASGNTENSTLAGTMINGITAIGVGKSNTNLDTDGDGVTDLQEIADGTLPNDPCSYLAANQIYANTTSAFKLLDCDNDGLNNGEEVTGVNNPATPANPNGNTSNPLVADTDGDGKNDSVDTCPNIPSTNANGCPDCLTSEPQEAILTIRLSLPTAQRHSLTESSSLVQREPKGNPRLASSYLQQPVFGLVSATPPILMVMPPILLYSLHYILQQIVLPLKMAFTPILKLKTVALQLQEVLFRAI